MKQKYISYLFFLLCLSCTSQYQVLNLEYKAQLKSQWCWVACNQMINNYIHGSDSKNQCQIFTSLTTTPISPITLPSAVSASNNNLDCRCDDLVPSELPDDFLPLGTSAEIATYQSKLTNGLFINSQVINGGLAINNIQTQIRNNSPLIIYALKDSAPHMIVVDGFINHDPENFLVRIRDPWVAQYGDKCINRELWYNYFLSNDSYSITPPSSQDGSNYNIYNTFYDLRTNIKLKLPRPRLKEPVRQDLRNLLNPPILIANSRRIQETFIENATSFYKKFQSHHKKTPALITGSKANNIYSFPILEFSYAKLIDSVGTEHISNPFFHADPVRFAVLSEQPGIPQINLLSNQKGIYLESIDSNPWVECSVDPATNKKECTTEMSLKIDNQNIKLGKNSIDYQFATSYYFGYVFLRFMHQKKIYYASRSSYKNLSINGKPHSAFTAYEEPILLQALHQRAVADRKLHPVPTGGTLYSR